jgi:hypothetical protein
MQPSCWSRCGERAAGRGRGASRDSMEVGSVESGRWWSLVGVRRWAARRGGWWPVAVVGLLGVHVGLLSYSAAVQFVTPDEVAHMAAGVLQWQYGAYGVYSVNPPLPRLLATLPWVGQVEMDSREVTDIPGIRQEFVLGAALVKAHKERYWKWLWWGRLSVIGWSVVGGILLYKWGRELYGRGAGLLALGMWCFGPNVLAHGCLVTPDLPAAVAGLAGAWGVWRYGRGYGWGWALGAGVLLGVALLCKYTCWLLVGVWFVWVWVYWVWRRWHGSVVPGWGVVMGQVGVLGGAVLGVINTGYEWQGVGKRLGEIPFVSQALTGRGRPVVQVGEWGNRFAGSWLGGLPVPLPEWYVRGLDVQEVDFELLGKRMPSYLCGEWRERGWWYYYVLALLWKVPLGYWVMVLWGMWLTVRYWGRWEVWGEGLLWGGGLAVLVGVSVQTGFNHHLRYVLPLVPLVVLGSSKVALVCGERGGWRCWVLWGLVLWGVGSSLRVYPHSLSYFNELAGGPEGGYRYLSNSNIDWGQDLWYLKSWVEAHPEAQPLRVAYFNVVGPSVVGLDCELPPLGPGAVQGDWEPVGPQPGWYAVSVNLVQGFPFGVEDGRSHTHWVPFGGYSYFQHFCPVAKAGYSIWIYHISLAEANRLRREMGLPLLAEPAGS